MEKVGKAAGGRLLEGRNWRRLWVSSRRRKKQHNRTEGKKGAAHRGWQKEEREFQRKGRKSWEGG